MNKTVIIDHRISEKAINTLECLGYSIIKFPSIPNFAEPISSHPDIFIAKIKDKLFADNRIEDLFTFCDKTVYCNREGDNTVIIEYPYDISFNCINVGKKIICNKKYTNKAILNFAETNHIDIIDVKQGYAKCSICEVSDNAIITEDSGIAEAALNSKIDVLKIEKGFIKLNGYDYGFIGGCSGLLNNSLLAFNGCIELHPQYSSIKQFCGKHNVEIVSLSDEPLYDIGSIIVY